MANIDKKKILIAGCTQEISSFNPVECKYDFFDITRGNEIYEFYKDLNSYIGGAIKEIENTNGMEAVFAYNAEGYASGILEHSSFQKISDELFASIEEHKNEIDGIYLSLHGAMSTSQELDPEGFILEEVKKIIGDNIPMVISLDLHGVLTSKMLKNCDGVSSLLTYPHVDFSKTGKRSLSILKKIIYEGAKPIAARVKTPALVRGKELITETGIFGKQTEYAELLYENEEILSAGFLIGNPFTDVPELCSQSYVFTNNNQDLAEEHALTMANDFWLNRSKMQTELISIKKSIDLASKIDGTVVFTDAADAPSSGSLGDSNAIISEMIKQNYPHTILSTVLDPQVAKLAHNKGVGSRIKIQLGGKFDKRFKPLELEWEVISLSNKPFMLERWFWLQTPGMSAVLKSNNLTVVITSNPVMQVDRAIYLTNNLDPINFHSVIVKSPHCEPEFYDDWINESFNVDSPGSTSANLPSLGHQHCKRPMYPMEKNINFIAEAEIYKARL